MRAEVSAVKRAESMDSSPPARGLMYHFATAGRGDEMRAHFYVVEVEDGRNFRDLWHEVKAHQAGARTVKLSRRSDALRLETEREGARLFGGDLVRIRMTDVPGKVRNSGGTSDIELEPDEGIGEETAFVYVDEWRVLAVQSNRGGPSAGQVAGYFSKQNAERSDVSLTAILDLAQLEQLDELASVSRMEVSIAVPSNRLASVQRPASVAGMIQAGGLLRAPRMDVTFSVGQDWRKKSLAQEAVAGLAKYLWQHPENDVEKLTINGRNDADEAVVLDLMNARLVFEQTDNTRLRRLSFAARYNFLVAGLKHHKDVLQSEASGR